jgi:hypothetical protein
VSALSLSATSLLPAAARGAGNAAVGVPSPSPLTIPLRPAAARGAGNAGVGVAELLAAAPPRERCEGLGRGRGDGVRVGGPSRSVLLE